MLRSARFGLVAEKFAAIVLQPVAGVLTAEIAIEPLRDGRAYGFRGCVYVRRRSSVPLPKRGVIVNRWALGRVRRAG